MGIFMLMSVAAPSAQAVNLLTYFNFNDNNFSSDAGQPTTLTNDTTTGFPSGNLFIATVYPPPPPPSNNTPAGSTLRGAPFTESTAGSALDLAGNANLNAGQQYCFNIGSINTTGQTDIMLSFALKSVGNGGQFDTLSLGYSLTGVNGPYTTFATDTHIQTESNGIYTLLTFNVSTLTAGAVDNKSSVYFQFCFTTTSGNNANGNDTLLDNIQWTSMPEPGTLTGGILGALGLCWSQRRFLVRSLRLRRT